MRMDTKQPAESVALSWRLKERGGITTVEFFGEIDEHADFTELRRRLKGAVVFHLAEVRRINSCGVREWVDFVRDLPAITDLVFTHCSPAIVAQLNMIFNFRGAAKIRSFLAPYHCEECGHEEEKLLDIPSMLSDRVATSVPEFACESCAGTMEFDDLPERFLAFLRDA